jgi:Aerotolerance regulator N-terminal
MSFYFANPWGLLGLLSLPAIVVIHMYHHRYPPLLVSGLHLWGVEMKVTTAGRKRERLPITSSLLLELLAALLIALTLANPTFGELGKVTHLVVVLDNSASMQAAPPNEPSFRDQAEAILQQRVEALGRSAVVTLMTTGRRVKKLIGPASWEEAKIALAEWIPVETSHDFQPAWDRASQVAEGSGELLFLTDHIPQGNVNPPEEMEIISLGRKLENIGFTSARWNFDSATRVGSLFLRIANYGRTPQEVGLRGTVGDEELFAKKTTLSAGESAPFEIPVPGGIGQIKVELYSADDALPVDNIVTLIEPRIRTVKVALALPEDHSARGPLEKVLSALPDVEVDRSENANLIVGPAAELPPSKENLWWLGVGPFDPSEEAQAKAVDLLGPYLLEKQHPLLEGVVLGGVVWGGTQTSPYDLVPVVSSGKSILLGQVPGTATTAFTFNLDFARSNLAESPDWPILMNNLIEQRRAALPGLGQWNYRLNEDVAFRLYEGLTDPAGDKPPELILKHETAERPLLRSNIVFIPQPEDTGVYEVLEGKNSFGKFAVNFFDPLESNLTELVPGRRAPTKPQTELFALDDPYSWLIMLGSFLILLAILGDWYVLKRK